MSIKSEINTAEHIKYIEHIEYASEKQINYIKYLLQEYELIEIESDQLIFLKENHNHNDNHNDNHNYDQLTFEILTKEHAYTIIKNIKLKYNLIDTRFEKQLKSNCIPIAKNNFFEIGWQIHDDKPPLSYLSFYNLLMIDWDEMTLMEIEEILKREASDLNFAIYQTYKGYHGYCITKMYNIDYKTLKFMKKLQCDPHYIQHCIQNGFILRLNKKHDRKDEDFVENFVKYIGNSHAHPLLHMLLKIKDITLQS